MTGSGSKPRCFASERYVCARTTYALTAGSQIPAKKLGRGRHIPLRSAESAASPHQTAPIQLSNLKFLSPFVNCAKTSARVASRVACGGITRRAEESEGAYTLEIAVELFNDGDYYGAHDVLEEMWHMAQEPERTAYHGILQVAVGLHHLLGDNHRGAMLE
ncbi:hypothetical protein CYMTET_24290, partial [Cymbomonas tetramitiformis]